MCYDTSHPRGVRSVCDSNRACRLVLHQKRVQGACLLSTAGLQERVEELKQVMLEDKSTKNMLKVPRHPGRCWPSPTT